MIVERIYISSEPRAPQIACSEIRVVANLGIECDRYFGKRAEAGQNITLVEAEEIAAFLHEYARPFDLSITRRNLVTRGVRLNGLVGREFTIGQVRLRGVELCEPCMTLGKLLATDELPARNVIERLLHRAGLRADVLTSGAISQGAAIAIVDKHAGKC